MTNASLPKVTSVPERAFSDNYMLESIYLPLVGTVGPFALNSNHVLTSIELPLAISINQSAFGGSRALESAYLPLVETISASAFSDTALTELSLPNVRTIASNAFNRCDNLTSVYMPMINSLERAFSVSSDHTPAPLTITLGQIPPIRIAEGFFAGGPERTIIVLVPYGALGYAELPLTGSATEPITGRITVEGDDQTRNWGNAFRGLGWFGSDLNQGSVMSHGTINENITIHIEPIP
jgi:hypothetical protein